MFIQMVITSKSFIYARVKALAGALDLDNSQFLTYKFSTKFYWTYIYFRLRQEAVERMIWRRKAVRDLPPELGCLILQYVGVPFMIDPGDSDHMFRFLFGMPPLWFIASTGLWDPNAAFLEEDESD